MDDQPRQLSDADIEALAVADCPLSPEQLYALANGAPVELTDEQAAQLGAADDDQADQAEAPVATKADPPDVTTSVAQGIADRRAARG